jgi:hypothetical protein
MASMDLDQINDDEFEISESVWTLHGANVAYDAGNMEEASRLYQEALENNDKQMGDLNPQLPLLLWNYGNSLYNQQKFGYAIPLYQRLINIQEEKLGKNNTKVLATLFRLATVYERIGDFMEAEQAYERAFLSARETLPPDHPLLQTLLKSREGMAKRSAANMEGLQFEPLTEVLKEDEWEKYAAPSSLSIDDLAALNKIPAPNKKKGGSNASDDGRPITTSMGRYEAEEAEKKKPKKKRHGAGDMLSMLEENATVASVLHSPLLQFALTIVLVMTAGSWFVLLKTNNNGATTAPVIISDDDIKGKEMNSADNQKSVSIDDNGKAKYKTEQQIYAGPTLNLSDDLSDAARVIPGSLFHKEIWLKQTADGLIDDTGTKLYLPNSSEKNVIDKMISFAKHAQKRFHKSGSYPIDISQLNSFTGYINPYTNKGDAPFYSAMYVPDKAGMNEKLESQAAKGEAFINEPTLHPGAINCCVLVLNKTDRGTDTSDQPARIGYGSVSQQSNTNQNSSMGTSFYIRGVGKDNRYILGDEGKVFYIKLDEGKSETFDKINTPPQPSAVDNNTRIVITHNPGERDVFKFFRQILPALLALLAVICGVAWRGLATKTDKESIGQRQFCQVAVIASGILLGIWFLVSAIG